MEDGCIVEEDGFILNENLFIVEEDLFIVEEDASKVHRNIESCSPKLFVLTKRYYKL